MEELIKFSESDNDEDFNTFEFKDDPFFCELSLDSWSMIGKNQLNKHIDLNYANPFIDNPDSPPKLSC